MKVSFANEIGNIAKAAGLDGQRIMSILCSDHKVSMSPHFLRPGFAFGGSCLPKDVRALRAFAAERQVASPLLDAVLVANAAQIARAEAMIHASGKTRVSDDTIFRPGGWTTFDALATYDLEPRLTLSAGIFNIFDRSYFNAQDVVGLLRTDSLLETYRSTGRSFAISATLRF